MITGREENIIRRMAPVDQQKESVKARKAELEYIANVEKTEQAFFSKWLNEQRAAGKLYYINARSDKPSTIEPGHPDYTIWIDWVPPILIEMKAASGTLSLKQQQVIGELEHLHHGVWIAWNRHQAIAIVERYLAQSLTTQNNGSVISQERRIQGPAQSASERHVQTPDRGGAAAIDVAGTLRSHSDYSDVSQS